MTSRAVSPPAWVDGALCAQVDVGDIWFPERGESNRAAMRICGLCPVQDSCLEHALAHDERWGVWGGTSEQQRRRMRHDRGRAVA